jgi:VWFA-related protein
MSVAATVGSWLAVLGLAISAAAQERAVPDFPVRADAITVDVVVLDGQGRPIRGLKASDFTVREDGKPQAIVAFEARDLATSAPPDAAAAAVGLPRAAGEETEAGGRTLGFVVDDLGLDQRGTAAIEAVRRWVRERADPRDEVTLATTSGLVEWRGAIGSGRAELLDALGSIRCRRRALGAPGSSPMTDWQAYLIYSGRQDGGAEARMLAAEIYDEWRNRARAVVAAIGAFSRAHGEDRGRKPLFVLAQGFIRDGDLRQFDDAIDVAQRGNVAVYLVDPRGLVAGEYAPPDVPAARGLEPTAPVTSSSGRSLFGDSLWEVTHHLDLGGGEQVAQQSGGAVIRDTNDLDGRLAAAVDESAAYYLLGIQPAAPGDGKWHDIDVTVAVKGATVRARRGYHASAQTLVERRAHAEREKSKEKEREKVAAAPAVTLEPAAPRAPGVPATPPAADAPRDVPVFASRADAVTVDVVVVDQDGRPVRDLRADEFTLLEDGQPMPIVGFEPYVATAAPEPAAAATAETIAATNEQPASAGGLAHAFLVDDLGIEPTHMPAVAKAVGDWLATGADARDAVTIATTSGDAWWSDAAGPGRADFDAVLARLTGKQRAASTHDAMSEVEAYRIDLQGPGGGPGPGPAARPTGGGSCETGGGGVDVLARVVDRWFRTGACLCEPMNIAASQRSCRGQATVRATEVYRRARLRAQAVLGGVERISRGLAGARGRKSVVVLSEGLIRDAQQSAFQSAVDASRVGNTAVSFVDVRGLVGLSFYGADQPAAPAAGDIGMLTAETARLATAGGEYLAQTTGGLMVSDSNDLAGGVARVAADSSAYYLLGYQPDRPPDGKWRRLEVQVARRGVKVRARRGYFATAPTPATASNAAAKPPRKKGKKGKQDEGPSRLLDPALAVGGQRADIPLRIAPYVMEADAAGTTRVLVAIEVGTGALTFEGTGAERTAQLDVTVLGVSRDGKAGAPLDSRVSLGLDAKGVGEFWMFTRELRLPRGPAQVRALVRDAATGRSGLVSRRFEVPDPAAPYLSTPILSDRIARTESGRGGRIVPVAHRAFPENGVLYCAYEVHAAPGRELHTLPKVTGAYTIEDEAGRVVASEAPTPIAIALGAQISRVLAFPLGRLGPGRFRLTIQAADRASGIDLTARETFVVEPAAAAATGGR